MVLQTLAGIPKHPGCPAGHSYRHLCKTIAPPLSWKSRWPQSTVLFAGWPSEPPWRLSDLPYLYLTVALPQTSCPDSVNLILSPLYLSSLPLCYIFRRLAPAHHPAYCEPNDR